MGSRALLMALCLVVLPASAQDEDRQVVDQLHKMPLGKVPAYEGFKYYSGYYRTIGMGNFPAMYAHGHKEMKITVVGRGLMREYPISEWAKALEAYRALLLLNGYKVPDR